MRAYKNIPKKLWLLILVLLVNRLGSTLLLFAPLFFSQKLGFSAEIIAMILTSFGIGAFLGSLFGGSLTNKLGPFKAQLLVLISTGILYSTIEFIESKYLFILIMFLCGIVGQALKPANAMAILKFSTEDDRTRNLSLERQATNLGNSIAPIAAGILSQWGIHWAFRLDAWTSLVSAFFLYTIFKDEIKKSVKNKKSVSFFNFDFSCLRNSVVQVIFLISICIGILFYQIFCSYPIFMTGVKHLSGKSLGYLLAINGVFILFFEVQIVTFLKSFKPELIVCIGVSFLSLGLYLSTLFNQFPPLAFSMIIFTLGEILCIPFVVTLILKNTSKDQHPSAFGIYGAVLSGSLTLASILSSWMSKKFGQLHVWDFSFCLTVIVILLSLILLKKNYFKESSSI